LKDVLDGMKEMFTRTQFAVDQGGYFPEIKVVTRIFVTFFIPGFYDIAYLMGQCHEIFDLCISSSINPSYCRPLINGLKPFGNGSNLLIRDQLQWG
jgi:hypothetical protein